MSLPQTLWRPEGGQRTGYNDGDTAYSDSGTLYNGLQPEPPTTLWRENINAVELDTWDDITTPITAQWDDASDTWDDLLEE